MQEIQMTGRSAACDPIKIPDKGMFSECMPSDMLIWRYIVHPRFSEATLDRHKVPYAWSKRNFLA
ncbi:hypothetical protein Fmac_025320 [Flemingia macrophylla]|uniref:Uncharacterized protein n=1 Tax=Flemingia macrophylla TaxID=520843 RepID=A0ABD1LRV5_9FABA